MRKFRGEAAGQMTSVGNPRLKLITMSVGLVLVVAAYLTIQWRASTAPADDSHAPLGAGQLALPQLPPGTLEAFDDSTAEARVLLDRDGLEVLLAHVRQLTDAHLEQLAPPGLDGARAAELMAQPAAHRGEYYSVRGEVLSSTESRDGGSRHRRAILALEDGTAVHALAPAREGETLEVGQWARLDGVFAKVFTDRLVPGTGADDDWRSGPLLVGARLLPSFPDFGPVTELPAELLTQVTDDTASAWEPMDEELRWRALAYARDLPEGAIDWTAATELEAAQMEQLLERPDLFRGQPFTVAVGLLQHITRKRAGENPARLDAVTEGWLAKTTWSEQSPVLKFVAPGDQVQGLALGDRASLQAFFLRNESYLTATNVRRVVPVFVAHRVAPFVPPEDVWLHRIGLAFIGLTVVLSAVILTLVRRDQRRAASLQEQITERRRARRARTPAPRP
jgi:hypothetical protein